MTTVRLTFDDQSARNIVSGRQTVLRLPVRDASRALPPPNAVFREMHWSVPAVVFDANSLPQGTHWSAKAPGALGDTLIGLECWRVFGGISDVRVDYRSDGASSIIGREVERVGGALVHYLPDVSRLERPDGKWRSSTHMPDWAARIRRQVVSVTIKRLQSITEGDAILEGARRFDTIPFGRLTNAHDPRPARWSMGVPGDTDSCLGTARFAFANAWNARYAKRTQQWSVKNPLRWDANPWVWRIEIEGP
jgi:hypothetical protein